MQKRRERIEKWRAEKKKRELEATKKEAEKGTLGANVPKGSIKAWSLEDDEEEEEGENKEGNGTVEEEDEVDPLDAFMSGIQEEVRKINRVDIRGGIKRGTKVTVVTAEPGAVKKPVIIMGVAKRANAKKKGELMEQNQVLLVLLRRGRGPGTPWPQKLKGKKELGKVDHTVIEYIPFRKDFYVEVPEIANMTKEEVDAYRSELEGIRVKGQGCPKPIKTWAQCGVSKRSLDVLKKNSYEKPTPIQVQAIPAIMKGRDVIGIAKTGSGKTLAFLLPMFRHVVDQPPLEDTDGPLAVIMTPTRELCMQIGKESKKFAKNNLRVCCVYGGTGISEQIAELKRGAEIIVCTPGRMIDMLAANGGRVTNLRRVTYVVLDEADRMFDLGFEPQVMRIIDNIQPSRQTVMFSATFPRQVEALAKKILTKPIEITVGGRSVVCKDVTQEVVILDEDQKFLKLLEVLGQFYERGQTIVFVDKQENADSLFKDLLSHSYRALVLHGGVDQIDRDCTMLDFKAGRVPIMVATSVAARGLDVKQLILVVNFDAPNHYEDYVHRCGRTGRAGNKGWAYTFLTPDQPRYAAEVFRALEVSDNPIPPDLQKLYDEYKQKLEGEGKKIKIGGGFHGKGFKFDESEANFASEKKKFQKAALGLADSDDEDIEHDIDQQIESMLNTKRTVKEIKAPEISSSSDGLIGMPFGGPSASDKLELARKLAQRINLQHNIGKEAKGASQQAAEFILKGGAAMQPTISAKTVAEQMAQKLNNKLNYQPRDDQEEEEETAEETHHKYEEELEINDFPQQASKKTILDLPPSSHSIKEHILRAFYRTYMQLHCLEKVYLDPRNFGYSAAGGILEPERCQRALHLTNEGWEIAFQWVPSHAGIPGNEVADSAARMALTDVNTLPFPLPLSAAKRLISRVCRSTWNNTIGDALRITSMGQYRSDSSPQPWIRKKFRILDGKNPPEGERKLFLAIESTSELAVSKAKAEIIRLIREELVKLRTSGGPAKAQGRYKVL
ncbi:putative ATP-dependent RNA helicase DDX46 [Chionoecetes opilio]|uniref:RNA helicase n=1 Tax=Chionoecetes opilio TaxID=41210 RepID=A0A8J4XP86_CHIOP|nr:putative ATP-dependent RNA helicase DDX46 [Chionoecetes opilio]